MHSRHGNGILARSQIIPSSSGNDGESKLDAMLHLSSRMASTKVTYFQNAEVEKKRRHFVVKGWGGKAGRKIWRKS